MVYKNDPSMQAIGFQLSHFVDEDVLANTDRLVRGESGQSLLYELGVDAGYETAQVTQLSTQDPV